MDGAKRIPRTRLTEYASFQTDSKSTESKEGGGEKQLCSKPYLSWYSRYDPDGSAPSRNPYWYFHRKANCIEQAYLNR